MRRLARGIVVACVALAAVAGTSIAWGSSPAAVHVALRTSKPKANDTLTTAPRSIRLDFTQAIEIQLARLSLLRADSVAIQLGPARAADSTNRALVTDIPSPLGAGTYRVTWSVTSRDSHTIRGEIPFTVLAAAVDTVPLGRSAGAATDTVDSSATRSPTALQDNEFDARSPSYVAIRWLSFVGMLGVIGALFFGAGVLRAVTAGDSAPDADQAAAISRAFAAARTGAIGGAVILLGAAALRLFAQVRTVAGDASFDPAVMSALLGSTAWGWGWLAQVTAAVVALGVAALGMRRPGTAARWSAAEILTGPIAVTLGVSAAVSGHPIAATPAGVAIAADAAHLIAAGGWIGTLGYVTFAAVPATAVVGRAGRPRLVRDIVTTFSRLALIFASIVVVTGLASSWIQLQAFAPLWTTSYGRVLLIKLALVGAVGAAGAYNWRVATPRLLEAGGVARIRLVMLAELAFAILVLAVTSVLVATPPPYEAMDAAAATTDASPR